MTSKQHVVVCFARQDLNVHHHRVLINESLTGENNGILGILVQKYYKGAVAL